MLNFLVPLLATLPSNLRSRAVLELENLALRHQIGVLQRSTGPSVMGLAVPRLGATGVRRWPSFNPRRLLPAIAGAFVCSGAEDSPGPFNQIEELAFFQEFFQLPHAVAVDNLAFESGPADNGRLSDTVAGTYRGTFAGSGASDCQERCTRRLPASE